MTAEEFLDSRIEKYMIAYDLYFETGRRYSKIPLNDAIWPYIRNVVDSLPTLKNCDMVIQDMVRDEVILFLQIVLGLFKLAEDEQKERDELIYRYNNATYDETEELWEKVYVTCKNCFSREEVNIDGYAEQMEKGDRQAANDAMTEDWKKSSEEMTERKKSKIVDDAEQKLYENIKFYGTNDYEIRRNLTFVYQKYPALQDIVRVLGRDKNNDNIEKEKTTKSNTSIINAQHTSHIDIEIIAPGNDLPSMTPIEKAIMADTQSELLFYYRFAHNQLQTFANKPYIEEHRKQNDELTNEYRKTEGPFIIAIDTSASMAEQSHVITHSLLMQILWMAREKKRKCYILTFSVRVRSLKVTSLTKWKDIEDFLKIGYTGGTNGEMMLKCSLNLLKEKSFTMADVLIISDFYFNLPIRKTLLSLNEQRKKGTKFYGLQIGENRWNHETYLDKLWKVKNK